jgi:PadR family transcriptional regulator, regulatory protein PadR
MAEQAQLLPGTLDLLILKAVSLGPLHGYGVLLRIEQISGGRCLWNKARSIRRCSAWYDRAC